MTTLTVGTALSGGGSFTLPANDTLYVGGSFSTTTVTLNNTGSTVNYTGSSQTLKVVSYYNLTLSGGAETFGAITTIGNNLVLSGAATASLGAGLTVGGTLNIQNGTFNANGQTLTVTGLTTVSGGTYQASTATQTLTGGLTVSGGTFTGSSGTVTAGTVTLSSGTLTAPSGSFNVSGGWVNNGGTFAHNGGTVTFNGTGAQNLDGSAATTFSSLTINNSAGVTLGASPTVNGTLTLTLGDITTGANQVNLGTAAAVSGGSSSSYVYGTVQKSWNAGGVATFTFPIGDATSYDSVVLTNLVVNTGGGALTATTTTGSHPQLGTSGINATRDVSQYWTLTVASGGFGTYGGTFNYPAPKASGTASAYVGRLWNGSSWSTATINGTPSTTTASIKAQSGFGDFAFGDQQIDHYAVTAGSSQSVGVPFTVTVTAQDVIGQTVVADSSTVVTMTGTGSVEFDSNGDEIYGDNTKTLASGTFGIATKDDVAETITVTATASGTNATSANIVIGAASGDYRTAQSGNWNAISTWQTNNGFDLVRGFEYPHLC